MFLTETLYFLCRVKLENMGLGALPASSTIGSWSLSLGIKQPGCSITPFSVEVPLSHCAFMDGCSVNFTFNFTPLYLGLRQCVKRTMTKHLSATNEQFVLSKYLWPTYSPILFYYGDKHDKMGRACWV